MEVNDSFSSGLGGDTLIESFYNKIKLTMGDWEFPLKNSEDLKGVDNSLKENRE